MCILEAAQVHENMARRMSTRPAMPPRETATARSRTASPCWLRPLHASAMPEGGLHVGLTPGPTGRAGQPHSLPQLGDRSREIPVVAQDDPDRLVSQ